MLKIQKKGKAQIKSQNRVRVFREILKRDGISRSQLEKLLSLSAPSVTRVVEDLMNAGLICEEGTEQTFVGRRPILLNVKKNAYYSIGINMSRTKLYICITNLGDETIYADKAEITGVKSGAQLLAVMDECVDKAMKAAGIEEKQVLAVGVASRGTVERERGSLIRYVSDKEEIGVREHLKKRFDCYILVENNVTVDLKYEYIGRMELNHDLVYIYVDEGVGGSIICNGEVVSGEHNMASKFAHMLVVPGGALCNCGKRGHLEGYISKLAIEAEYKLVKELKEPVSLEEICKRANAGEPDAHQILDQALEKLAVAVTQLLLVLNPGTIVVYGDIFEFYEGVIDKLKEKVGHLVFARQISDINWVIREKSKVRIENSVARLAVESALETSTM
ncbi:ROK family transcriptional regulator [Clostridium sp. chh4-2]|uniref:ROK family transcriptional regulator n=1 Tax=Clostridium sp. chh4-2 TaxID=2067550 RepID=UPI000CCEB681|nr:ROK family transcriptional regulator [Clostridium sp. chh4-2]PNV63350.1 ROK family transcriptional regulator [Clostridium sp. chh4-2]